MDPAFGLAAAPPAAGARILTWTRSARAWHATDRLVSKRCQRMPWQPARLENCCDFCPGHACQRIKPQMHTVRLNNREAGSFPALIALATRHPRVKRRQGFGEWRDLAQLATRVGIGGPQFSLGVALG